MVLSSRKQLVEPKHPRSYCVSYHNPEKEKLVFISTQSERVQVRDTSRYGICAALLGNRPTCGLAASSTVKLWW